MELFSGTLRPISAAGKIKKKIRIATLQIHERRCADMKISTGGRTNESEENASIPAEELCESTRLALADEKELTDAQKAHLKECDFYRCFQNETEILKHDLASLDVAPLAKNGVGLADSVMEEIGKQAIFGRTPAASSARPRFFRHAGLAAACLVVFVLAAPTAFNLMHTKNAEDTALINETAPRSQAFFLAGSAVNDPSESADEESAQKSKNGTCVPADKSDQSTDSASDVLYSADALPFNPADALKENKTITFFDDHDSTSSQKNTALSDTVTGESSGNAENEEIANGDAAIANTYDVSFSLRSNSANGAEQSSDTICALPPSPDNAAANDISDTANSTTADTYDSSEDSLDDRLAPSDNSYNSNDSGNANDAKHSGGAAVGGGGGSSSSSGTREAGMTEENKGADDVDRANASNEYTNSVPDFIRTACQAANARFGSHYAIDSGNAVYTRLSESSLYVDIPVSDGVHLQVFMTLEDGIWKISTDTDGNEQIFEVTARYNILG